MIAVAATAGIVLAWQYFHQYKPQAGIPSDALNQRNMGSRTDFDSIVKTQIDSAKIIYFNSATWENRADAQKYLDGFLVSDNREAWGFPMWSQYVGALPEIECRVSFKKPYQKSLGTAATNSFGRLLIWKTECCYQDATGTWWFVSPYEHFHSEHPEGNRNLAR